MVESTFKQGGGLIARGSTILVATALDERSAAALARAHLLARAFHARVQLVHSLPWNERVVVREQPAREAVADWASRLTAERVSWSDVTVSVERPWQAIATAARATGAALVVLGALRDGAGDDVMRLALALGRPLLVASVRGRGREVLAATDMRDPRFPVVRAATELAAASEAEVTVVHNVEPARLGTNGSASLAPSMRALAGFAAVHPIQQAHFAVLPNTTRAISTPADTRKPDILAVRKPRPRPGSCPSAAARTPRSPAP